MTFLSRLAALFRKRELDSRIDQEMLFHLEIQIEENIRRGMSLKKPAAKPESPAAASNTPRNCTATPAASPSSRAFSKTYARRLRQSPGFTAAAVLTLALGLSVNATIN